MNEIVTLLEHYWISRDKDRELYNKVKREIPKFQKFAREQLGWKLLNHERFLKLEKIPANAQSFMGIQEFQEVRDYVILCVILMYLEDKEEQEQFLLSELIDYAGVQLGKWMEVDWNSFSQRKSMVRVLQYVERMGMLRVYDGSSQLLSQEIGQEVLYENTGLSRYFATSFPFDIRECTCWQDFEKERLEEFETGDISGSIVSIVPWPPVRRCTGIPVRMQIPCILRIKGSRYQNICRKRSEDVWISIKMPPSGCWKKEISTGKSIPGRRRFQKPFCFLAG